GLSKKEVRERMDDIVDFAEIGNFVNLPMKSYSSGMGARLRFAISASAVPDILMIDEALATGDAAFRAKSKAKMDEVREAAGTVFLVSHSLNTIKSMCSRVLWVHEGKLVLDGGADEVCAEKQRFPDSRAPQKKHPAAKKQPPLARTGPERGPTRRRGPADLRGAPSKRARCSAVRDRSRRGTCAHWRTTMFSESMNRPTGEDIVLMTCATWPGCMIVLGSSSGARVLRSAVAVRPGDRHTTRVP